RCGVSDARSPEELRLELLASAAHGDPDGRQIALGGERELLLRDDAPVRPGERERSPLRSDDERVRRRLEERLPELCIDGRVLGLDVERTGRPRGGPPPASRA